MPPKKPKKPNKQSSQKRASNLDKYNSGRETSRRRPNTRSNSTPTKTSESSSKTRKSSKNRTDARQPQAVPVSSERASRSRTRRRSSGNSPESNPTLPLTVSHTRRRSSGNSPDSNHTVDSSHNVLATAEVHHVPGHLETTSKMTNNTKKNPNQAEPLLTSDPITPLTPTGSRNNTQDTTPTMTSNQSQDSSDKSAVLPSSPPTVAPTHACHCSASLDREQSLPQLPSPSTSKRAKSTPGTHGPKRRGKQKPREHYSEEHVKEALDEYFFKRGTKDHKSLRELTAVYGIPNTTLRKRRDAREKNMLGDINKCGRPTILGEKCEQKLKDHLLTCAERGFGKTRE